MHPIEGSKISRSDPVDRGLEPFELFDIWTGRERVSGKFLDGSDNLFL